MEINGTLHIILPEQKGTSSKGSWIKQEFIIETTGQYPKKVAFSVWGQDKVDQLNRFNPGDAVNISFSPESREYNVKWYTDLRAWKIQEGTKEAIQASQASVNDSGTDDLPF